MYIAENVSLANFCTMKLGGNARHFAKITSKKDLVEAVSFAKKNQLPILPIGEGSNTVFTDKGFDGLVIKIEINSIKTKEATDSILITAGGGLHWDEVVAKAVSLNLTGIESLSSIPGTAGAAPVQNIGAYGQELSDTFVSLEAFDLEKDAFVTLLKKDCGFGYRTSIFKTSAKNRYIITSITLSLKRGRIKPPLYTTLQKYMKEHNLKDLAPATIRQAVSEWRAVYLPDPKIIPSAGSFFGNPIINKEQLIELKRRNPEIANWPTQWYWELSDGRIKVAAGRLAEVAGLKDWHDSDTGMATWRNQALVFVNENARSYQNLEAFKNKYLLKIRNKFGITLEQEPETI